MSAPTGANDPVAPMILRCTAKMLTHLGVGATGRAGRRAAVPDDWYLNLL